LKRFVSLIVFFCCILPAAPAFARRSQAQRHRRHRIAHTHRSQTTSNHAPRHPRSRTASAHAALDAPAKSTPQIKAGTEAGSDIHPIVLSAAMKPRALIASGTVTPSSEPPSEIEPIAASAPAKPSVLIASGTVTASTHVEVLSPRILLSTSRPPGAAPPPAVAPQQPPAPTPVAEAAPKPYVLPGHALPLDTELTLLHNIAANPAGIPLSGDSLVSQHHPFDFGISGTTLFTPATTGSGRPGLYPQTTVGALFNIGTAPMRWLNFRFNYQFSQLSETYTSSSGQDLADISTHMQEFTGEYLIGGAPSLKHWNPFFGIGGGILRFSPGSGQSSAYSSQTRPAFLADPGVRIPTPNPHVTFRIDARILGYRAPDFNNSTLTNPHWTITAEPSLGILVRF
jgi:hypothetical protein